MASDNPSLRVPPPPRDPSPKARQLVLGGQGGEFVLLLVGGIFTLVGSILAVVFCWTLPVDLLIAARPLPVAGTVTSTSLNRNVRINRRHPTTIHFSYQVDGTGYQGATDTLDDDQIARATTGAEVPVETTREHPEWSRVRGTTYGTFGYFGSFVLLFPLLGLGLMGGTARTRSRRKKVFTHGTPTQARVVSSGPLMSVRINGRHPFQVRWEFPVDGRTYSGAISSMRPQALEEFAKATEVTVLFDPDRPQINTLYVD